MRVTFKRAKRIFLRKEDIVSEYDSFVLIARISSMLLLHFFHSGLIPPDVVNTNGTKVAFSTSNIILYRGYIQLK